MSYSRREGAGDEDIVRYNTQRNNRRYHTGLSNAWVRVGHPPNHTDTAVIFRGGKHRTKRVSGRHDRRRLAELASLTHNVCKMMFGTRNQGQPSALDQGSGGVVFSVVHLRDGNRAFKV